MDLVLPLAHDGHITRLRSDHMDDDPVVVSGDFVAEQATQRPAGQTSPEPESQDNSHVVAVALCRQAPAPRPQGSDLLG